MSASPVQIPDKKLLPSQENSSPTDARLLLEDEKESSSRFGQTQKFQHPIQIMCSGPFYSVDQIDERLRRK